MKKLIVVLALIVAVFAALVVYGVYSMYSFITNIDRFDEKTIPSALGEPRVLTGAGFLQKTEIFRLDSDKFLEQIAKGSSIQDEKERQRYLNSQSARGIFGFSDVRLCGEELIAVGRFGGFAFDLNSALRREIVFEQAVRKISVFGFEQETFYDTLDELKIDDFDGDGKCEFYSHSSVDGVTVFDAGGNAVWRHGQREIQMPGFWSDDHGKNADESWITGAFAGDLNGDGKSELIVTMKKDGIRAFDQNHAQIWFQPDEFPTADYKVLDLDGDGQNEIVEFQGAGSTIRNIADGSVLKKLEIDSGTDGIFVLSGEKEKKQAVVYRIDDNRFRLFDLDNKEIWSAPAPLSEIKKDAATPTPRSADPVSRDYAYSAVSDTESVYKPSAVGVSFASDAPQYVAVLASFASLPRTHLYVYDAQGRLVYHELLPEEAETLAVVPVGDGREGILIGGKNTIRKYTSGVR